jgi:hypothetical protein
MLSESHVALMQEAYAVPPESSSEEANGRKRPSASDEKPKKRRRTTTAAAPAAPAARPSPPESYDDDMALTRALTVPPRFETMPDLLRAFPHLDTDEPTCALTTGKLAASQKRSSRGGGAKPTAAEASEEEPVALQLLMRDRKLAAPNNPRYRLADQPGLDPALIDPNVTRTGDYSLPCYPCEHESRLLVQSGVHTFAGIGERHLPPCYFGRARCVGMRGSSTPGYDGAMRGLTEPVVWMRAMSPAQLDTLIRHGVAPAGDAPCVQCHRANVCAAVHSKRLFAAADAADGRPGGPTNDLAIAPTNETYQLWRNLVGEKHGYAERYMLRPRENEFVVAPIVESTFNAMFAYRDQGIWRVNQEALYWRPQLVVQPRIGERLSDF